MSDNSNYRLRIYQRQSSSFVTKILLATVFIQFPLGSIISYLGYMSRPPWMYFINGLWLFIVTLLFRFFLVKKSIWTHNHAWIKYAIQFLFAIFAWISIYNYRNDIYMKLIWVHLIIISVCYFDKKLTLTSLILSICGLISLDIIQPVSAFPQSIAHYYGTSIILNTAVIMNVYAVFNWILGIKLNIDNTMDIVSKGIAYMNHALKNELYLISICMDNIKNKRTTSLEDNYQYIDNAVNHLSELSQRMQQYISTSRELEKTNCNLSTILDESVDMINLLLSQNQQKKLEIIKYYKKDISLYCDHIHVKEVILNLLKNSVEAIKDNGVISVNVKENRTNFMIEIIDNGCGISPHNLPQVVDPFFSTKGNRTDSYGIGLTYVNSIMTEHQGMLDIFSEEEVGTTILLYFPKGEVTCENRNLLFFRNWKHFNNCPKFGGKNS